MSQQIWLSCLEGKLHMSKEFFRQKFFFIERQSTELDNLAFVAMATNLPWKQRKVQLQFRSLDWENAAIIIPQNLVFKQ